ncbi:hypothetical protein KCU78_g57, partial [Aureobasidium melanogenum]
MGREKHHGWMLKVKVEKRKNAKGRRDCCVQGAGLVKSFFQRDTKNMCMVRGWEETTRSIQTQWWKFRLAEGATSQRHESHGRKSRQNGHLRSREQAFVPAVRDPDLLCRSGLRTSILHVIVARIAKRVWRLHFYPRVKLYIHHFKVLLYITRWIRNMTLLTKVTHRAQPKRAQVLSQGHILLKSVDRKIDITII